MISTNRDETIDIVKALTIILMVYGHTFGRYSDWVYMFHMPVLFMISGYCWKKAHAMTSTRAHEYIFNRLRRLIIPYFLCCLIFTFLNNIFLKVNVYTNNSNILLQNDSFPVKQSGG